MKLQVLILALLVANVQAQLPAVRFKVLSDLTDVCFTNINGSTLHIGNGTNYVTIDTNGFIRRYGLARPWDDLRVDALRTRVGSSAPSFDQDANGLYLLMFSKSQTNEVHFTVQLPHAWATNTPIEPHLHWKTTTATASNNVVWGLEYSWIGINQIGGATLTTRTTNGVGSRYQHTLSSFGYLYPTNQGISSVIYCRVFRDGNNTSDNYDDTVALLSVDFHYMIDTLGSRLIYEK